MWTGADKYVQDLKQLPLLIREIDDNLLQYASYM
jgi:hypothetical protein